jgi:uncharacterized protein YceH (UPF0502 family)
MEHASGVLTLLLQPLAIGLYIGLAFSLFVFLRGKAGQRQLKKEIETLKRHLQMKLDVESEENERRRKDLENLKKENENLRIAVQAYAARPGRRELRILHVYQKAVDTLTEMAPGFAQSWRSALRDAEEEVSRAEQGFLPLVKRLIPWAGSGSKNARREKKGPS